MQGDESQLGKIQPLYHFDGKAQMPIVDWIECTAKDTGGLHPPAPEHIICKDMLAGTL